MIALNILSLLSKNRLLVGKYSFLYKTVMRLVHRGYKWRYVRLKMSQRKLFAQPVKECAFIVTLHSINHVLQAMKSI